MCKTISRQPMPAIRRFAMVYDDESDNEDSVNLLSDNNHEDEQLREEKRYRDLVRHLRVQLLLGRQLLTVLLPLDI
jgi:hypothetical protein